MSESMAQLLLSLTNEKKFEVIERLSKDLGIENSNTSSKKLYEIPV